MQTLDLHSVVNANQTMPAGTKVLALFANTVLFAGIVKDSRVKYGGAFQYTITTLEFIKTPWNSTREIGETVLVNSDEIIAIY